MVIRLSAIVNIESSLADAGRCLEAGVFLLDAELLFVVAITIPFQSGRTMTVWSSQSSTVCGVRILLGFGGTGDKRLPAWRVAVRWLVGCFRLGRKRIVFWSLDSTCCVQSIFNAAHRSEILDHPDRRLLGVVT